MILLKKKKMPNGWRTIKSLVVHKSRFQNAPRPSEHPPVRGEKCQNVTVGSQAGCKYKTSSWHLNGLPDGNNIGSAVYNVGEKLTVILWTYINCHAGPHQVSSKISGRSPPLYCTLTLISMQGHQNHNPFYLSRSSGLQ